ncbi:organic radical activating enzyme [Thermoflavifilum aggregans]|uniref:7-carboxy-7-deazaguanine synthase n=1 Tax=Thermoflavifilum aggregans TaxID=454188 RepID=A0A2M9CWL5_9BACT|nr:7-carboxy-7-deazaguanine synthase QueE [Thermoflavifilum aggregans]PJJ76301.1 organic radical activating enzyme [Thermoflavifilum aggregans]
MPNGPDRGFHPNFAEMPTDTAHIKPLKVADTAWPLNAADPGRLPVMETFYSLQGEGFHQGRAAFFIRLAGCDVGCVWCDVKESWATEGYLQKTVQQLADEAAAHPARLAIVTGGEPTLYDLSALCDALHQRGFRVHLETSGAHEVIGDFDWICLSPKKFKPPLESVCRQAHELKVVIYHRSDFSWAESYARQVSDSCRLYLQPEWSRCAQMAPLIIAYIQQHPQWELSLQLHKYVHIP